MKRSTAEARKLAAIVAIFSLVATYTLVGIGPADAAVVLEQQAKQETVPLEKTAQTVTLEKAQETVPLEKTAQTVTLEKTAQTVTLEKTLEKKAVAAAVQISGLVRAVDGKTALAGAEVRLTDAAGTTAIVKTDATGAFKFASSKTAALQAGTITVRIAAPGIVPIERSVAVTSGVAVAMDPITATAATSLRGVVFDAGSKLGVAGAAVTLTDAKGVSVGLKSDAKGGWSFVSSEAKALAAGVVRVAVSADGFKSVERSVDVGADLVVVDIALAPKTFTVTGVVADAELKTPLTAGTVKLTDAKGQVFTAALAKTGTWKVASTTEQALAEGKATIIAEARGYKTATASATVEGSEAIVVNIDMEFAPIAVSGLLTDRKTGLAIPGAKITVRDADGRSLETSSDVDGKWAALMTRSLILDEGKLLVKIGADRFDDREVEAKAAYGAALVLDQALDFQSHVVEGTVLSGATKVAGAKLTLADGQGISISTTSSSDGSYSMTDDFENQIEAGTAKLTVAAAGFQTQVTAVNVADVASAGTYNVNLVVVAQPAATLGTTPQTLAFTGAESTSLAAFGFGISLLGLLALSTRRRFNLSS